MVKQMTNRRASFGDRLRSQFAKPTGFLGGVTGFIMAFRKSNKQRGNWTLSLLDLQPTDRILEIGFGPGTAIQTASESVTSGLIVGVDHSEVMLHQTQRRNAQAIASGIVQLYLSDVANLPSFQESFDKVFSVNTVMFWQDPIDRLRELRGLMRQGGIIALTYQPRSKGATSELTERMANKIEADLSAANFTDIRKEILDLKPVSVVCVIGRNPGDGGRVRELVR